MLGLWMCTTKPGCTVPLMMGQRFLSASLYFSFRVVSGLIYSLECSDSWVFPLLLLLLSGKFWCFWAYVVFWMCELLIWAVCANEVWSPLFPTDSPSKTKQCSLPIAHPSSSKSGRLEWAWQSLSYLLAALQYTSASFWFINLDCI